MYTSRSAVVLLSAWAAGVLGCTASAPPPTQPEGASAPPAAIASGVPEEVAAESEPEVQPAREKPAVDIPPYGASQSRIMEAHFKDALLIREAVISGRYEEAADPATVIANVQNLNDLPKGWRRYVEHMQATAGRVTNGTSAAAAAAAAADLGVSCGLCHQEHGGPKASTEAAPAMGVTVEDRMSHHAWATERLWEGLAVPSSQAWRTGSNALVTGPFPDELLKEGGVDVRTSAQDFARLVAKASQKKTIAERASLYAELLVTCGTCHQAIRVED